jgi:hypothetical protein
MKPGDVFYIWIDTKHLGGADAKFKYAISVDPEGRFFLLINSDPRRITSDQNVQVKKAELPYLPNDISYIDTSRVITLTRPEFKEGMQHKGAKECGALPEAVIRRVLPRINESKTLPIWQKRFIAETLLRILEAPKPKPPKAKTETTGLGVVATTCRNGRLRRVQRRAEGGGGKRASGGIPGSTPPRHGLRSGGPCRRARARRSARSTGP